jgi:tol-pal system protein YbgF
MSYPTDRAAAQLGAKLGAKPGAKLGPKLGALLCLMALMVPLAPVSAADPALEARLSRLERMLNERSLSDLVLQIQQLQQEVQDLRGQVEVQQYLLQQQGISSPAPFGGEGSTQARFGADATGASSLEQGGRVGGRFPPLGSLSLDPPTTDGNEPSAFVLPGQQAADAQRPAPVATDSGLLGLPAPETSVGGERDLYRDAFELLKARDYPAAREAFAEMISRYPQGQFADNGRYWLGEIGYVTQDYSAAQTQFSRLVTDYPLSPRVPEAMLKLGYVYDEQDQRGDARAVLEEVVRRFPDTTEARLAQGRLDRMQPEGG